MSGLGWGGMGWPVVWCARKLPCTCVCVCFMRLLQTTFAIIGSSERKARKLIWENIIRQRTRAFGTGKFSARKGCAMELLVRSLGTGSSRTLTPRKLHRKKEFCFRKHQAVKVSHTQPSVIGSFISPLLVR